MCFDLVKSLRLFYLGLTVMKLEQYNKKIVSYWVSGNKNYNAFLSMKYDIILGVASDDLSTATLIANCVVCTFQIPCEYFRGIRKM